jgi:hypothetical protein
MAEPIKNDELKRIGVDFDNTLCKTGYENGKFNMGDPTPGAKEFMEQIVADGFKPYVYTARADWEWRDIETWMTEHDIPFSGIITGKPLFIYYIDDKAISFKDDWNDVYDQIHKKHDV